MINAILKQTEDIQIHPTLGPITVITNSLYDGDRELSNQEVEAAFLSDNIIGVCVIMEFPILDGIPMYGRITDISDDFIYVNDVPIDRSKFHDWYELD